MGARKRLGGRRAVWRTVAGATAGGRRSHPPPPHGPGAPTAKSPPVKTASVRFLAARAIAALSCRVAQRHRDRPRKGHSPRPVYRRLRSARRCVRLWFVAAWRCGDGNFDFEFEMVVQCACRAVAAERFKALHELELWR